MPTLEDLAAGVAGWADFTLVTRQDANAGGWVEPSSMAAMLEDDSLLMVVTHQDVLAEGGTNSSTPARCQDV